VIADQNGLSSGAGFACGTTFERMTAGAPIATPIATNIPLGTKGYNDTQSFAHDVIVISFL
jgi:hypothetical protein